MFTGYIYTNQPSGPNYVVTAQKAAIGAGVVLSQRNVANQPMQLWIYDSASQTFALASSERGGTPLVIDASNGPQAPVSLQPVINGKASQTWDPYVDAPYIDNVGFPGQVLDDYESIIKNGNPILCWPKNNPQSQNQMWTLVAASNAEAFEKSALAAAR
jgi:hypothetical protein